MLALYYRWALQSLSALSFFHSRSVYPTFFSSTNAWLRSDYSLAVAGFINVDGPELDADSRRDAWKLAKRNERRERRHQKCASGRAREPDSPDEESSDDNEEMPADFSFSWDTVEWAGNGSLYYEDYPTGLPRECWSHRESL